MLPPPISSYLRDGNRVLTAQDFFKLAHFICTISRHRLAELKVVFMLPRKILVVYAKWTHNRAIAFNCLDRIFFFEFATTTRSIKSNKSRLKRSSNASSSNPNHPLVGPAREDSIKSYRLPTNNFCLPMAAGFPPFE